MRTVLRMICGLNIGMMRGCVVGVGLLLIAGAVLRESLGGWLVSSMGIPWVVWFIAVFGSGVALVVMGCGLGTGRVWRAAGGACLVACAALCLRDSLVYWGLLVGGRIGGVWVPLSVVGFVVLGGALGVHLHRGERRARWDGVRVIGSLGGIGGVVCAFPVMQMVFFGNTDYSRRADAAVVFGARVYVDGSMSDALTDRVASAVGLYHEGRIDRLVMSGGPGDGAVSEAKAMARYAVEQGVPAGVIVLDERGLDTTSTLESVEMLAEASGWDRVIGVSHFYHLPRIKMASRGLAGVEIVTVPAAQQDGVLMGLPYFMARESAAWWVYWAKGLA